MVELNDSCKEVYDFLTRIFPEKWTESEYHIVLKLLYPHMSQRNIADVVSVFGEKDWATAYHDVLGTGTREIADVEIEKLILDRFKGSGLMELLEQDE